MGFPAAEKQQMLALKGVGEAVVARLQQLDFSSRSQLAGQVPADITRRIAQRLGSAIWHNSPQARSVIQAIVALAQRRTE